MLKQSLKGINLGELGQDIGQIECGRSGWDGLEFGSGLVISHDILFPLPKP